jgi:putative transposase
MGTIRVTAPTHKGHRHPIEVISHAVWLYHRCTLSLRGMEELMLQRGVVVSHETIRTLVCEVRAERGRSPSRSRA